jgi:hypothetical protein
MYKPIKKELKVLKIVIIAIMVGVCYIIYKNSKEAVNIIDKK